VRSLSNLIVDALWLCCEADRILDNFLCKIDARRQYHSTKGQDRWLIEKIFKGRRSGYFVEVGAGDGRTHSNTYVLERDHDWIGLAVEANPLYFASLRRNRKCTCIHACIDAAPGHVDFYCHGYLGGIIDHDTDNAHEKRGALIAGHPERIVRLEASPLLRLLEAHGAPSTIDYLSLDVEGAEYRILRTFPFDRFRFECLTVERPTLAIHKLLRQAGYVLEKTYRFDGFYVSEGIASRLGITGQPFEGIATKFF
jgi:FkbM family methyltransferase